MSIIYENDLIKVEIENSEIPWLKIFTQKKLKRCLVTLSLKK